MPELVTAATTERSILEPVLDARAANLFQFNPTPEVDSAMERALSLAATFPPGVSRGALVGELEAAIRSNSIEGARERSIAGFADTLVSDLRSIERNTSARKHRLAAKAITRLLREPLRHLAQPVCLPATDLVRTCRVVTETIASTPRAQLLTPTVRHELGAEKYKLLERLVDAHHKKSAGGLGTSGATTQGASPGHGQE